MIEGEVCWLKRTDIEEAVDVYKEGMKMEKPPGQGSRSYVREILEDNRCIVYKEEGEIKGLAEFEGFERFVELNFMCALEPGKGIGSCLMKKLAEHCKEQGFDRIVTGVSNKDERAQSFYDSLGFVRFFVKDKEEFKVYKLEVLPEKILEETI